VGNSRKILNTLIDDLSSFIGDSDVTYTLRRLTFNELEFMQDMRAQITLYQDAEEVIERVAAYKGSQTRTIYGIDLTIWRGYRNDSPEQAELILLDYRDYILDWAFNVDAGLITDCKIDYFGYDGASGIVRLERTVSQTMRFIVERELILQQRS
jgi:hypothetical protein